jgi:chorismate mutase
MGFDFPPLYGIESIEKKIDKISKIDEKINELLIEREHYVAELKEEIKKQNNK